MAVRRGGTAINIADFVAAAPFVDKSVARSPMEAIVAVSSGASIGNPNSDRTDLA